MLELFVKTCAVTVATIAAVIPADVGAETLESAVKIVNPPELFDPAPNGYSHAVVASDARKIAYLAGQGGEDATGSLSPVFEEQVQQAHSNLKVAIQAVGARPDQVTKITTYVVGYDQSMLKAMTEQVVATFGDALPAQTLVPVPRLALDGMLFEVDAIVVLRN